MSVAISTISVRHVTLDVVRGIAVMGILVLNIAAFALPYPAYANPAAYGGDSGADLVTWMVNFVLFDGKMRGLFSILFGASTLLIIDRATASGRHAAGAHFARMIVLLGFGLVHFYFVWWGDILVLYAMCGMMLYFMRDKSARWLSGWAIGLIALSALSFSATGVTAALAERPGLSPSAAEGFAAARDALEYEFGADSPLVQGDLALYRSDYAAILDSRFNDRRWDPFRAIVGFGLETIGLMMLGMGLFRSGFLTGDRDVATYRMWSIRAALFGFPPLAVLAWWQLNTNFNAVHVALAFIAFSTPFDVLLAVGWAAAIIWWVKAGPMPALKARVAAAGRMAFTNYLATSVVMSSIFYGYGGDLFGEVNRAALWPFVIGMWMLILAWSKPWLERFHYGPMEWLWRSLSRLHPQPFRKR